MRGADSLTISEVKKLIAAVDKVSGVLAPRDYCLLEVLAATGLRVSECVALKVSQVVKDGAAVDVLHLDRKNTKRGKGGKLPLSERLQGVLVAYTKWLRTWYEGDYLFPGYREKHLSPRSVQIRMKALARHAKIKKKISPHSLRKFFIQRLVDQKLDLRTVQELSRHANLESLHNYLIVDERAAKKAVSNLL